MDDDHMPMLVHRQSEYDQLVETCWYREGKVNRSPFPRLLPFSQLLPLCCSDIRNYINYCCNFMEDNSPEQAVIYNILTESLDKLLIDCVSHVLLEGLRGRSLEQIVQTLINFEHFRNACDQIEVKLQDVFYGVYQPVHLLAKECFEESRRIAEKHIYEVVNEKIDGLSELAEYDWTTTQRRQQPSTYLRDMVDFLSNVMDSTLVNLPDEIKGFMYLEALDHLARSLMEMLLSVPRISDPALANFRIDVQFLDRFVQRIGDPKLFATFDEVRESTNLMMSATPHEEYQSVDLRMRNYSQVKGQNVPRLLEK